MVASFCFSRFNCTSVLLGQFQSDASGFEELRKSTYRNTPPMPWQDSRLSSRAVKPCQRFASMIFGTPTRPWLSSDVCRSKACPRSLVTPKSQSRWLCTGMFCRARFENTPLTFSMCRCQSERRSFGWQIEGTKSPVVHGLSTKRPSSAKWLEGRFLSCVLNIIFYGGPCRARTYDLWFWRAGF